MCVFNVCLIEREQECIFKQGCVCVWGKVLECEEGVPKVFFFSIQKGRLTLSRVHFKLQSVMTLRDTRAGAKSFRFREHVFVGL